MRSRSARAFSLAVSALLGLAVLSGCSTVRGWVGAGTSQPARAGASVSIPLGK